MKKLLNRIGLVQMLLVTAFAFAVSTVSAQEITGSIEGTVLTPDGQPAVGVSAIVTDSRDGRSRTATAGSSGLVSFRSMSPGGPYTIRITGAGYKDLTITDMYTNVAGTSSFTVALETAGESIEEVVVTAAQIQTIVTASGPSSSFSLETINDMPSTTRQIRDVIRLDPRVSIGETGDGGDQSGAISCLGGSSRTNSFTVDGVRATDAFGLNLSGNLSRFTFPIPFDTVDAAAVEFSPVSVEYGQFSGCNVNVVTKSGTNEFHGGGFYLYNDDSMTNDKIDGETFEQGTFERENYGVDIGGPIFKDKLFFYAAYEKFETASVNPIGSADDTSFPRNDTQFTTAELDRIKNILINSYGRDPGDAVRNLPVESERVFGRIDWNINEDHRLEATYSTVEEATLIRDDIGSGRGEYTFADNFHARGSESETMGFRFYSDWTDRLSTEVRWSTQEVTDLQNPFGGGEAQDEVPKPRIALGENGFPFFGEFGGQEFVSGPGTFRSANKLSTNKDQLKIKFDYQLGDHLITAGYEYETLDVFNLFIINATGTVFFAGDTTTEMIDNLEAGNAVYINQGVSFTRDPNDAAAIYTRDIHSYFLQDQWQLTDRTELIFGVRYDEYKSNDLPIENDNYVARYGFTNQVGFDGLDAMQPRIGLNHTLGDSWGDTRISLGFGVFSGNDPTVWFSNAYQNFGGALGLGDTGSFRSGSTVPNTCTAADLQVLSTGSFNGIPDCVVAAGQNQALDTLAAVNATDPNLELPTAHRYSFGIEHNTDADGFFGDWNLRFDYIYADLKDQVDFLDLSMTQTGTLPDGRPSYTPVDPLRANCNATFNGLREGFSNVTPDCFGANQDIFFTNKPGNGGSTETISIQMSKLFEWGSGWQMNFSAGYAYNDSQIGNPGNSFTASGNHRSVVYRDLENPTIGPSYRVNPHNFVLAGSISKNIFGDNRSSLSFFFNRRKGNPISVVHFGDPYADAVGDQSDEARYLLYVPTDENDPIVQWDDPQTAADFFAYTDKIGLKRGAIAPKGALDEPWQSDLDIRIQQEIPLFGDAKGLIYFDIENVLNLIDDSWGSKRYINTTDIASAVGIIETDVIDDGNGNDVYLYSNFDMPTTTPDSWDSLYRIQMGLRFTF